MRSSKTVESNVSSSWPLSTSQIVYISEFVMKHICVMWKFLTHQALESGILHKYQKYFVDNDYRAANDSDT